VVGACHHRYHPRQGRVSTLLMCVWGSSNAYLLGLPQRLLLLVFGYLAIGYQCSIERLVMQIPGLKVALQLLVLSPCSQRAATSVQQRLASSYLAICCTRCAGACSSAALRTSCADQAFLALTKHSIRSSWLF